MTAPLQVAPHPLLQLGAFWTDLPAALGELPSPPWLQALLLLEAEVPLRRGEAVRGSVRDLLRHGGYKPTGRGKPASEFLLRAAEKESLNSINLAVDACNVVSLHSGLPISVVDADLLTPPLKVALADSEACYVFNPAGQEIRLGGLLCLHDEAGPCGNGVKDSQRSKTHAETRRTLSLVWGTSSLPGRTEETVHWYRELLDRLGAQTVAAELLGGV